MCLIKKRTHSGLQGDKYAQVRGVDMYCRASLLVMLYIKPSLKANPHLLTGVTSNQSEISYAACDVATPSSFLGNLKCSRMHSYRSEWTESFA